MKDRCIIIIMAVLLLSGCHPRTSGSSTAPAEETLPGGTRAVYFWKGRFELDGDEILFLMHHSVKRIYLRLFDAGLEEAPMARKRDVVPLGTVKIISEKPEGVEIVPTVFITVPALRKAAREPDGLQTLAGQIVTRVLKMCDYHDLGVVHELQLDCDWTKETQEAYFALCRDVKAEFARKAEEGRAYKKVAVSSTIRLHQLRTEAPPVDRGTLMLYNTGNVRNLSEGNSILSPGEVRKFLGRGHVRYKLPLDFAWPAFSWGVWYREGTFMGLLHRSDFSDASRYASSSKEGWFDVTKPHMLEGHRLLQGDLIRVEDSPIDTVLKVQAMVDEAFAGRQHRNILYHLDSKNLSKYTPDEIETLYRN